MLFDVSPENVHAQSGMLTCPHAAILGSLRQPVQVPLRLRQLGELAQ